MKTVSFVNATIGFSENLFLVSCCTHLKMQPKSLKSREFQNSNLKRPLDLFSIILRAIMREFCFNTGRNRAKQHSSVVDWGWLNKNMKDRLLNCFIILTIFILSTLRNLHQES